MQLADVNVSIALAFPQHFLHGSVQKWFDAMCANAQLVFCRSTQQSFLRLITTASVAKAYELAPLSNAEAWKLYERTLSDSRVGFVVEPAGIQKQWKRFTDRGTASPKLWMDAYLAAFAVAGGYGMVTADTGFRQFPGLGAVVLTPA